MARGAGKSTGKKQQEHHHDKQVLIPVISVHGTVAEKSGGNAGAVQGWHGDQIEHRQGDVHHHVIPQYVVHKIGKAIIRGERSITATKTAPTKAASRLETGPAKAVMAISLFGFLK